MLMECSVLLMGNTVEMAGGDMYSGGYHPNILQCAEKNQIMLQTGDY